MKQLFSKALLAVLAVVFIASCKKETETVDFDYGYNYLPGDSGSFVIYKVDSFLFDDFNRTKRTSTIYLKEKITDQHIDNLGRIARKVERYYSDTLTSKWQLFNVHYIVKTDRVLERWEDNLRYVKLVFPADEGASWLGNKFITVPPPYIIDTSNYRVSDWLYTIEDKDVSYNNGTRVFDSTLTVFHIYDSSAINKTFSTEKYARNIGLVYKEFWIVTGQTNIGDPWFDRAEKGFIMFQYAIDYGNE